MPLNFSDDDDTPEGGSRWTMVLRRHGRRVRGMLHAPAGPAEGAPADAADRLRFRPGHVVEDPQIGRNHGLL